MYLEWIFAVLFATRLVVLGSKCMLNETTVEVMTGINYTHIGYPFVLSILFLICTYGMFYYLKRNICYTMRTFHRLVIQPGRINLTMMAYIVKRTVKKFLCTILVIYYIMMIYASVWFSLFNVGYYLIFVVWLAFLSKPLNNFILNFTEEICINVKLVLTTTSFIITLVGFIALMLFWKLNGILTLILGVFIYILVNVFKFGRRQNEARIDLPMELRDQVEKEINSEIMEDVELRQLSNKVDLMAFRIYELERNQINEPIPNVNERGKEITEEQIVPVNELDRNEIAEELALSMKEMEDNDMNDSELVQNDSQQNPSNEKNATNSLRDKISESEESIFKAHCNSKSTTEQNFNNSEYKTAKSYSLNLEGNDEVENSDKLRDLNNTECSMSGSSTSSEMGNIKFHNWECLLTAVDFAEYASCKRSKQVKLKETECNENYRTDPTGILKYPWDNSDFREPHDLTQIPNFEKDLNSTVYAAIIEDEILQQAAEDQHEEQKTRLPDIQLPKNVLKSEASSLNRSMEEIINKLYDKDLSRKEYSATHIATLSESITKDVVHIPKTESNVKMSSYVHELETSMGSTKIEKDVNFEVLKLPSSVIYSDKSDCKLYRNAENTAAESEVIDRKAPGTCSKFSDSGKFKGPNAHSFPLLTFSGSKDKSQTKGELENLCFNKEIEGWYVQSYGIKSRKSENDEDSTEQMLQISDEDLNLAGSSFLQEDLYKSILAQDKAENDGIQAKCVSKNAECESNEYSEPLTLDGDVNTIDSFFIYNTTNVHN